MVFSLTIATKPSTFEKQFQYSVHVNDVLHNPIVEMLLYCLAWVFCSALALDLSVPLSSASPMQLLSLQIQKLIAYIIGNCVPVIFK